MVADRGQKLNWARLVAATEVEGSHEVVETSAAFAAGVVEIQHMNGKA